MSDLANLTQLSIHTLRYYEKYGLIKGTVNEAVTTNNYKQYDESLIEKIELIKEAKEIGFTLSEIKKLLDDWYDNKLSINKKIEVLTVKIAEIDAKMYQLGQVRQLLVEGIEDVKKGKC